MDIAEHKITAMIGPSGCGKSTLLKSLNRMNDLVEGCRITGSVTLDGEDVYGGMDVNLLRKRVGMVFQKPNPFPMSIYDNVAYGPRTHGVRGRAKLDEIVERSLRDAAIWDEVKDCLLYTAEQRSGEVLKLLAAVRTEFAKYEESVPNVRKRLQQTSEAIDAMDVRARKLSRSLRDISEEAGPQ